MTRTVGRHYFPHVLVERLAVFGFGHIYEINDDNAAHVAQTKLSGYLVGSPEIYFECVCLLIGSSL